MHQRHTSGSRCIEEENGKVGGNMISVGVVGSLGLLVVNASFRLCVQHLQVISSQGKRVSLVFLTGVLFFFHFFSRKLTTTRIPSSSSRGRTCCTRC